MIKKTVKQLKNEIKYNISLNEEQKEVKRKCYEYDVNVILGNAGSGKTQCACLIALDMLFKKQIDKIIISRPINFKATGYLSGSISEKLEYHLMPIKQSFYAAYDKRKIDKLFEEGIIQIIPIDYMRGVNFKDAIAIIDEIQETSYEDFKLILTRLCKGSKLIFTGSEEQVTDSVKNSAIHKIKLLKTYPYIGYTELLTNHRNESIFKILKFIDEQNIII